MTATLTAASPVGQIVSHNPSTARVFERYRIDYCCGGKMSLQEACGRRNVDVEKVIGELEKESAVDVPKGQNWLKVSMTELADHIVTEHHDYLRLELPRIAHLAEKVARVHGDEHPELVEVKQVFDELSRELTEHTMKEETILFPWIRSMENGRALPPFPGMAIAQPIKCMEEDHDEAGRALERLSELTDGFVPPMAACNTWRVLLASLKQLEEDLHVHIHKENSILFPRALAVAAAQ